MRTQVEKLTPEALISAPRRGPPVPNSNGTLALYTQSTHKIGDKTLQEVRVMDIHTASSKQLSDNDKVQDANWIPGSKDQVLYLKSGEKGRTEVVVANGADVSEEHYVAAEIDAPVSALKLKALEDGSVAFVVVGQVGNDGSLHNEQAVENKSSGRVFDTSRVRFWNGLYKAQRHSLWYNKLVSDDGRWKLAGDLINLIEEETLGLNGCNDDTADTSDSFDVSTKGIAFLTDDLTIKAPDALFWSTTYYAPLNSFTLPPSQKPHAVRTPQEIGPGTAGAVKISPDASTLAYLFCPDGSLSDLNIYMAAVDSNTSFNVFSHVGVDYGDYDPPMSFEFTDTSDSLLIVTEQHARHVLLRLKLEDGAQPQLIFRGGSVSSVAPLQEGNWDKLLVSGSTIMDSSVWQIVDTQDGSIIRTVSSATKNGAKFGLSPDMLSEIWFQGADDICVHSWVIRPSDFDETKKYPWILIPHGGPRSSYADAWSNRWNLAAWAEQGYVIVAPNITGSTGFGAEFADRVNEHWGGRPYQDLLNLIRYLEQLPYLDQDKAVLAGASYGGYMVSWMMGHDIINKFCCAIWHDGVYSVPTSLIQGDIMLNDGNFTDAPYPWLRPDSLDKWNPAKPELLRNWIHAPPTLVIHSERDYRCPIVEGIAMVNSLHGLGVPTRFLTFPDEGHWVNKPENSLVWHRTVFDWIKRCVGGDIKRGDTKW